MVKTGALRSQEVVRITKQLKAKSGIIIDYKKHQKTECPLT